MLDLLTEDVIYKKSPQEITVLLYEVLIDNLEMAIEEIDAGNFENVNKRLQKSNDILQRLGVGLNYEAGIITDQLDALYNYSADRIIEANFKKDKVIINEVLNIINSIANSWNEASKSKFNTLTNGLKQKAMAYEKNIMLDHEK